MSQWVRNHWEVAWLFLLSVVFVAAPQLDLAVSALFYRPGPGFFLGETAWVQSVHHVVPVLTTAIPAVLTGLLALAYTPLGARLRRQRLALAYLLLSFALGPGLLVNGVFKSHWGRARPVTVQEFGGDKSFTPALLIADQCRRNCSFVCGHASAGFVLCALGFLTRRRVWFGAGFVLGMLLGLARVAHGKHFLSDVVFSFFAVYFCAKGLHFLMFGDRSPFRRRWPAPLRPAEKLGT